MLCDRSSDLSPHFSIRGNFFRTRFLFFSTYIFRFSWMVVFPGEVFPEGNDDSGRVATAARPRSGRVFFIRRMPTQNFRVFCVDLLSSYYSEGIVRRETY